MAVKLSEISYLLMNWKKGECMVVPICVKPGIVSAARPRTLGPGSGKGRPNFAFRSSFDCTASRRLVLRTYPTRNSFRLDGLKTWVHPRPNWRWLEVRL